MTDAMDALQDYNDQRIADALQRHAARPRTSGLTHCEVADCREPIRPQRTVLGARLCEECQEEDDKRSAHFGKWRQR